MAVESADSRHVVLGRLGAAYGVKGWMKLISYTDPADNILGYHRFLVREGRDFAELEIDQSQAHGKGFIAHVRGCDDRDLTRLYTGRELLVATSYLPPLPDDEYYWHQLEGLKVINLEGELLGRIAKMMETGANDVMVLKATTESIDDQERLIPWLMESVVKQVDLDSGEVRVDWDKTY